MYQVETRAARRFGKATMNIAMAKIYIEQGKRVVFMTVDQRATITMLAQNFPKALFELIDVTGIVIHQIKIAPLCIGCHQNRSDPPSKLCPGCQAYKDNQL